MMVLSGGVRAQSPGALPSAHVVWTRLSCHVRPSSMAHLALTRARSVRSATAGS